MLHRLGATPCTEVTILSDGADGPRSLGEAASLGPTCHVLDWFHLAMRIQHVAQAVKGWPDVTAEDRQEGAGSPMLWSTSAGACGAARSSGHSILWVICRFRCKSATYSNLMTGTVPI